NFSSRFQFMAEDRTQANILVKGCEADKIETKGRCFARLPGQNKITELQTPYISERQIAAIAPHIQGKDSVTVPSISSTTTTAPPLSFVVGPEPEPTRPTAEEMTAIEAFVNVRDSGNDFYWKDATQAAFGKGKFGKNYTNKLRRILKKFGVGYSKYEVK
ncbi:MAG: hypothetical protein ACYSW6_11835, partial [Planctomycetota bacterium]